MAFLNIFRKRLPTHAKKQSVIRDFARRYQACCLVETGTLHGDMVAAMKNDFARIYSIELGPTYHAEAAARFAADKHVEIILGDSAQELARLMPRLTGRTLFWLDAHYSGGQTARGASDTPIAEELRSVFAPGQPDHIVLIDDAREFGANPAYPSIPALTELVRGLRSSYRVEVADDIIRVYPP